MHLLLIAVWFSALGLIVYLAVELVRDRLSERREKRATAEKLSELKKRRYSALSRHQRTRSVGSAARSSGAGFRRWLVVFGVLALVLWELYWGSVVAKAHDPSEIPRFFLFSMMVIIPVAVYFVVRGMLRRSARFTVRR